MATITTAVQVVTIDSTRIIHEAEVDLVLRKLPEVTKLVQYDDSLPVIAVSLSKAGSRYTLPTGAACNIRWKKPDDTVVYNPVLGCDSTRSVVYVEITLQMTTSAGEVNQILEVIVNGRVAGSSPLRVRVERNPIQEDDIESTDEAKTIIGFVDEAKDARDEAVAAADEAEASAETAESWADEVTQRGEYWVQREQEIGVTYGHLAEAWAVGERGGVPVPITDETYHNNAKWYKGLAESVYTDCRIATQTVEAYIPIFKMILGTVYLNTEGSDVLCAENGDRFILDF